MLPETPCRPIAQMIQHLRWAKRITTYIGHGQQEIGTFLIAELGVVFTSVFPPMFRLLDTVFILESSIQGEGKKNKAREKTGNLEREYGMATMLLNMIGEVARGTVGVGGSRFV
jgi:hypothetical protein